MTDPSLGSEPSAEAATNRDPFRKPSRRAVVVGAAWAVPSVMAVKAVPAWAASPHDAVICPRGNFTTNGRGRLLSGSLLGINLDTIAAVNGIAVSNDGHGQATAAAWGAGTITATPVAGDAYAFTNPLNVGLVNGALANIGAHIALPLNTPLGVVNQYGRAVQNGFSAGASGTVSDSGAIETQEPAGGWPELATVDLRALVDSISPTVGALLGAITNLKLTIGAVAGRATLDACPVEPTVNREYLLAYIKLLMNSPALATLVTTINNTALPALETAVNGLSSDSSVLSAITSGVNGILAPLLGVLGSSVSVNLSATLNLTDSSLTALLTQPFGDDGGVLTIDPDAGTVQIDLGALLAKAYPGQYSNLLNGLAPNTELVVNDTVLNALTAALSNAIDGWLADLDKKLYDLIQVNASIVVNLTALGLPVAKITLTINASLASLLAGTATVGSSVQVLGTINTTLLDSIVAALVSGVGQVVGNAIDTALSGFLLTTAVGTLVDPVVTQVANLVKLLFIDQAVLKLIVNAQNSAVGAGGPADFSSAAGEYEVAALWLGVLPLVANGVNLYLARAWVGQNNLLAA